MNSGTSDADRHRRVTELFDQAVDLPQSEWPAFVAAACGDDVELRRRVLALLEAERSAPQSFLAQPALHLTAKQLVDRAASVIGTQLGPYRVGSQIGAGGMGTVYEAHDSRLDRKVAIKLLPPAFAGDSDRISRFRKEARAASLLNHPNIVSIYDAELDHGRYYIATEFVEGQTLREFVKAHQPESKQVIEIGIQVCSALGAAHGAGIVHRDIKPENVMIRPDGIVKVLDFGLAKLREPVSGERLAPLDTRPGNIAGTLQYLSPEQITGKPAGPRSDIFSLGIVLYELATGSRPFVGATDGAIFAAILHDVPPRPRDVRASIEPELDALIMRALEKDPDLRFQTAADLGSALKRLQRDSMPSGSGRVASAAALPVRKPTAAPRLPWLIAAAALAACVWMFFSRTPATPPQLPVSFQRLTNGGSEELYPALSPDGQQFVYASPKAGNWDIYLKRVGGETEINLTKDSPYDDIEPAFSPDGKFIAFHSGRDGGGLFVMETTGENPRRISKRGFYPSWSPDAKQIVYSECDFEVPSERHCSPSQLFMVDLATETERSVSAAQDGIQPSWSPHGDRIAFWGLLGKGGGRRIFTMDREGKQAVPIAATPDSGLDCSPVWSPDGNFLYFLSARGGTMNVWRVPIDEKTGKDRGEAMPITTPSLYVRNLSTGKDGTQFVFTQSRMQMDLYAADFDPAKGAIVGSPVSISRGPSSVAGFSLSPDEKQIAFDNLTDSQEDLWIMNVDGSGRRRLTADKFKDRSPAWSPAGDQIAFYSDRASNDYDVWSINADGSGLRRITQIPGAGMQSPGWSPDGKRLLIHPTLGHPAYADPAATHPLTSLLPVLMPGFEKAAFVYFPPWHGNYSRWLGWTHSQFSPTEIFQYDPLAGTVDHLGVVGEDPHFLPGQRQFVFFRIDSCLLYDLDTHQERQLFSVKPHRMFSLETTRDGRRIYFTQANREGEVWLARMKK